MKSCVLVLALLCWNNGWAVDEKLVECNYYAHNGADLFYIMDNANAMRSDSTDAVLYCRCEINDGADTDEGQYKCVGGTTDYQLLPATGEVADSIDLAVSYRIVGSTRGKQVWMNCFINMDFAKAEEICKDIAMQDTDCSEAALKKKCGVKEE